MGKIFGIIWRAFYLMQIFSKNLRAIISKSQITIGVARGGQGRAFARPSLIFALPLKSCQSKKLFILPHSLLQDSLSCIIIVLAWQLDPVLVVYAPFPFGGTSHMIRFTRRGFPRDFSAAFIFGCTRDGTFTNLAGYSIGL